MEKTKSQALIVRICLGVCLAVVLAVPSTPLAASKDAPIELRFAHHNPPAGRTTVKFVDPWVKRVQEATHGRVRITTYPAQSLASTKKMLSAVESGLADMAWVVNPYFPGRFPLTEVICLPFLALPSAEKNGRIIQELYEKFPDLQKEYSTVKLLFLIASDPYFIATTKKPVRNLDDLRGLKLKVSGSFPTQAMKNLGTTPVGIPLPGTYEAAEKGVIDGGLIMWAMVPTWNFAEVFDYWTDVALFPVVTQVSMNLEKWNSLPADIQKDIMSVCGVAGSEFAGRTGWGPEVKEETYAAMKKAGTKMERIELDPGELEKWKKIAGEPIWKEWVQQMEKKGLPGQELLDEALRLVEKYR